MHSLSPIVYPGRLLLAIALTLLPSITFAAEKPSAEMIELFEKQIRPTLIQECVRCHGPDKQQGGLRLDTRAGWATGGDSGPAVVPGKPGSLLLSAISYNNIELEMPPRGKLPERTIEAFQEWVASGAYDPRQPKSDPAATTETTAQAVQQGRSFWSFQPLTATPVPTVVDRAWPKSDIDRFVLSKLEQAGIAPVSDASRLTLLRRLYYDLIGLPPTPQQIDEFLNDSSPTAYEDLVDRLLDSHHFGERWGRHWLDVVRFAESSGGGRTLLFPDAWRYRDYVIDSFNRDVPYDRFVIEQIAGDLLEWNDTQERVRNLTATAFLLLGPTNYEMQDKDILEMDIVDEQLDTIGKSMLGMTIGCARCHDHKFDPIPAHDYYALAGILKSTKAVIHSNVSKWNTTPLPLPKDQEAAYLDHQEQIKVARDQLQRATKLWKRAGGGKKDESKSKSIPLEDVIGAVVIDDTDAKLVGQWTQSTAVARFVGEYYIHDATERKGQKSATYHVRLPAAGTYEVLASYTASGNRSARVPIHIQHRDGESLIRINQKKMPSIDQAFESLGTFEFDSDATLIVSNDGTEDGVVIADSFLFIPGTRAKDQIVVQRSPETAKTAEQRKRVAELKKEVDRLTDEMKRVEQSMPPRPVVMATTDLDQTGDIHLSIRGQAHQKGELTPRGALQVASWNKFPPIADGQSGRNELALWIADRQNPLTSRVMANRVWYWLIGRGIVASVDNFGSMGDRPTHPELLDHLAKSLVQQGWSIKRLIRQIVNSRVYQLSTAGNEIAAQKDPNNRLLWQMNRKRLRAEDIRDSLLTVAGSLDRSYGGSNIKTGTTIEYGYKFTSTRRSVYVPVFRNTLPEIFEVFDFADPNIQRGQRNASTVASQALLLMNQPRVIEQAHLAASNLINRGPSGTLARVRHAYRQVLGRDPTNHEELVAVDFVAQAGDNGSGSVASSDSVVAEDSDVAERQWALLYQVLFQCIDFRYLN